jgi:calcineurin-like phosphoesterase family protein
MRTWYTSDPHFGHEKNALRRGFASVEEHDAVLIESMSKTVRKNDTLVIAGDLSLSRHKYALELIAALPGTKQFVLGNHDPGHPMHRSSNGIWQRAYLEVFDTVTPFQRRKVAGVEFAVSHFPYASWGDGPDRDTNRHAQWRLPETDYPLVHGHTHGTEREHGNQFHVGWDAWGALVPEEIIIDWVRSLPGMEPA